VNLKILTISYFGWILFLIPHTTGLLLQAKFCIFNYSRAGEKIFKKTFKKTVKIDFFDLTYW